MPRIVLVALFLATPVFAQTLTVDGANSPLTVSASASYSQVTVATGGTLVVNAPLTVSGPMTVQSGGRVTVDVGVGQLKLNVTGALIVDNGGVIEADGKGLRGAPAAGLGDQGATLDPLTLMVVPGSVRSTGGSHVTQGGRGEDNLVGASPFGNPYQPVPGGGGGRSVNAIAGSGGGVLDIAAGSLMLNGQLRASGENGVGNAGNAGGGAGGSVALRLGAFSGGGLIAANGGAGGGGCCAGSGGAGQIRATYTSFTYAGGFQATQAGAPVGTIHLLDVTLDQRRIAAGITTLNAGERASSLVLSPGADLYIAGRAEVDAPLVIPAMTSVTLSSSNALGGLSIATVNGTLNVRAPVAQARDLALNGLMVLDSTLTVPNLETVSSAVITHSSQLNAMHLVVTGRFNLAAGASVRAAGLGYSGGWGPFGETGATFDAVNNAVVPGSGATNGGSHGGLGARYNASYPLAPLYDDPNNPRFGGGGGGATGANGYLYSAGNGGGVIRVTSGSLNVDGTLSADGTGGSYNVGNSPPGPPAGGAGGSVVVTAGELTGLGLISARGGAGGANGGAGGGGGLIKITSPSVPASLTVSAAGGAGAMVGGDGVITKTAGSSAAKIISTAPSQKKIGDALNYQAIATGSGPITWSLISGPAGSTVDASTGLVSWVVSGPGPHPFSLQASNLAGVDTQAFTVAVVTAPSITSTAATTATIGVPYAYDADGRVEATGTGPITLSATLAPIGFTVDPQSGQVSWTPSGPGSYSACVNATNVIGAAQQCFTVLVGASTATGGGTDAGVISGTDAGVIGGFDAGVIGGSDAGGIGGSDAGVIGGSDGGSQAATAPRFTSTASTTAFCGTAYHYSGARLPEVSGAAPFTFSVSAIPGAVLPTGLAVDPLTGAFSWVPTNADTGPHGLELTVTNAAGQDRQVFSVFVDCNDANVAKVGASCASVNGLCAWCALLLSALFWRRREASVSLRRP